MRTIRFEQFVGGLMFIVAISFVPASRGDDGYIEASDDESCQAGPNASFCSTEQCSWCANQGRCFFDEALKLCAVGANACKDSPACRLYGRCTSVLSKIDGRALCVAGDDTGCAASVACATRGLCGKAPDVQPTMGDDEYRQSFDWDGTGCVATKTPMCAASRQCRTDMLCVARRGRCEAKNQSACSRFEGCKKDGRCKFTGGACEVETDKDCRRSEACKRFGACVADGGSGQFPAKCVAGECGDSEICKRYGACETRGYEYCGTNTENPDEPECPREQWVQVKIASVTASSTMPAVGEYRFDAAQLFDGDLATSWQPARSKAHGIQQRLVVKLAEPAEVIALEFANGFQREDSVGDQFVLNSRVSRLYVELDPDTRHIFLLDAERRGLQELYVKSPDEPVTELKLEIVDTAPGTRWQDPAISEIKVFRCAANDD